MTQVRPLPSLKKKRFSRLDAKVIGNELGIDWRKIKLSEFQSGLNHELEHRGVLDNTRELGKVVLDHLKEDPLYYTKIKNLFKHSSLSSKAVLMPTKWQRTLWYMRKTADPYYGKKVSKKEAGYVPDSNDKLVRCLNCEYFNSDSSCDRVEGKVSPDGLCKYFELIPKQGVSK